MKRITTLSEALTTGRVTVDADGVEVELFTEQGESASWDAAIAALNAAAS